MECAIFHRLILELQFVRKLLKPPPIFCIHSSKKSKFARPIVQFFDKVARPIVQFLQNIARCIVQFCKFAPKQHLKKYGRTVYYLPIIA